MGWTYPNARPVGPRCAPPVDRRCQCDEQWEFIKPSSATAADRWEKAGRLSKKYVFSSSQSASVNRFHDIMHGLFRKANFKQHGNRYRFRFGRICCSSCLHRKNQYQANKHRELNTYLKRLSRSLVSRKDRCRIPLRKSSQPGGFSSPPAVTTAASHPLKGIKLNLNRLAPRNATLPRNADLGRIML